MPPRQARPPSTESLLPPILNLLQPPSPNPYSAHQKALTTTARLAASGHHSIAIEICFAVSRELLKLGESGSGVEIGVKMIGYMSDSAVRVDDKSRANVTQLLALTPSAGAWRKKLADSAVKWSSTHGDCPTGDPNLHQYLGEMYYKDRLFAPAEQHLLNSGKRDAASLLAELMFEWSDKGALDPGPYAARGVLPFLDQKPPNILAAGAFLTRFLSLLQTSASSRNIFHSTLPSQDSALSEIQVTSSSTLNFLQLALITAQRAPAVGASAVQSRGMDGGIAREWESLCGRYSKSSGTKGVIGQREVQEVLGHIATEVFLVPQRGGQGGGDLLQNLMGSLFGGGGAQPGAGRGAIGGR